MSKLVTSVLAAAALFAGLSAASARAPSYTDLSHPVGGYDLNSPDGIRAFWEDQSRRGN